MRRMFTPQANGSSRKCLRGRVMPGGLVGFGRGGVWESAICLVFYHLTKPIDFHQLRTDFHWERWQSGCFYFVSLFLSVIYLSVLDSQHLVLFALVSFAGFSPKVGHAQPQPKRTLSKPRRMIQQGSVPHGSLGCSNGLYIITPTTMAVILSIQFSSNHSKCGLFLPATFFIKHKLQHLFTVLIPSAPPNLLV